MKKPLPTRDGFFTGVVKHWRNINSKLQAPNLRVSGVRCQVSGKKNKKLKPEH
jgi:hypothetical protein